MLRNYMKGIQHASARRIVAHEDYTDEFNPLLMPSDRVPSLQEIVQMFTSGRPMDSNLDMHLDYNELERNPVLAKGFDLVDFDKLAKANKATLEQVEQELQDAKLARANRKETLSAGTETPPTEVKSE